MAIKNYAAALLALLFVMSVPAVSAQTEADAGTTPDSLFWGLDVAMDNLRIAMTTGDEDKVRKRLEVASERLEEIEEMLDRGEIAAGEKAREKHAELLSRVAEDSGELDADDDAELLADIVDIETSLAEQQVAVRDLDVRIRGDLSEEQRAQAMALVEGLSGNLENAEIRVRVKKGETVVRIKSTRDDADAVIAEAEDRSWDVRAENRIAQAEHRIEKAEARLARFHARLAERYNISYDALPGAALAVSIDDTLDEDSDDDGVEDADEAEDADEESVEEESPEEERSERAEANALTGRASDDDVEALDEDSDDDGLSAASDDDVEAVDDDSDDDGVSAASDDDEEVSDDDADDDGVEDASEDDVEDLSDDDADDADDDADEESEIEVELEEDEEQEEEVEDGSDNILRAYNLTVPDYEPRGIVSAEQYLADAKSALAVAEESFGTDNKRAYAYATYSKRLANIVSMGKYVRLTEADKDFLRERRDAARLAEREARDGRRAAEDAAEEAERAARDAERDAEDAAEEAERKAREAERAAEEEAEEAERRLAEEAEREAEEAERAARDAEREAEDAADEEESA